VIAAGLLAMSALVQASWSRQVTASDPVPAVRYLRSPEVARRLALSYDLLLADVYWLRALQEFGRTRLRTEGPKTYADLYPFLDLTTSLDPRFTVAYRFGAIFLSEAPPGGPGRPEQAIALLEKGIASTPDRWEYYQDIGFVHYWWSGDAVAAASWFDRGSQVPGAPWWLRSLAATTLAAGGDRRNARVLWEMLRETAEHEWLRADATRRLQQLDAMDQMDALAAGVERARRELKDVLLVDTAGRLHIDEAMMAEIKALHQAIDPIETLFVVDAMTGQDAANTARAFGEALPLTGVILTKADGDARGGAALSVRKITGVPIKFLGMGERSEALEPFHPERVVSRILGMGDVLTLVEEATRQVDQDKAEKLARKLKKGRAFNFNDLHDQLSQMQRMGGIGSLLEKLPGAGQLPDAVKNQTNDREIRRMMAVIGSMTEQERRHPELIKGSRKRRIAAGSGAQIQDVNRLLKQHTQMSKAMKKFSKGGAGKMMRALGGRLGGMGGMGGPGAGGFPFR
jgi:hypothetical protein